MSKQPLKVTPQNSSHTLSNIFWSLVVLGIVFGFAYYFVVKPVINPLPRVELEEQIYSDAELEILNSPSESLITLSPEELDAALARPSVSYLSQ